MAKVTKAVIAAAGFGTRFLPQTKAMPKEMLPVVDKPVIQIIAEQLVKAGIQDIIIVSGYSKRSIEDHFDVPNEDLLNNLRAGGPKKAHYISELEQISSMANFAYVRQKGPYGPATPILNAAHLLGNEPFIYTFADDIMLGSPNMFQQLINAYDEFGGSIVPCVRVKKDSDYERYGILGGTTIRSDVIKASTIVEKPGKEYAPSDMAAVAGYLLDRSSLSYLESGIAALKPGQEFYVTDSVLQPMLNDNLVVHGVEIKHNGRYDTGNPLDYVKTVIDFALARDDMGSELREHLQNILQ
jgi:UTP--glucose-1-phosphate uridylyltransferase